MPHVEAFDLLYLVWVFCPGKAEICCETEQLFQIPGRNLRQCSSIGKPNEAEASQAETEEAGTFAVIVSFTNRVGMIAGCLLERSSRISLFICDSAITYFSESWFLSARAMPGLMSHLFCRSGAIVSR